MYVAAFVFARHTACADVHAGTAAVLALHRSGMGCWTILHVRFRHLLSMTIRHVLRGLLKSLLSTTASQQRQTHYTDQVISVTGAT
jgi:hypothetical protein